MVGVGDAVVVAEEAKVRGSTAFHGLLAGRDSAKEVGLWKPHDLKKDLNSRLGFWVSRRPNVRIVCLPNASPLCGQRCRHSAALPLREQGLHAGSTQS